MQTFTFAQLLVFLFFDGSLTEYEQPFIIK